MYIILEAQSYVDGTVSTLVSSYDTRNAAENKYHLVLAAAAISELPRHSAFMLSDEGYLVKSESYTHETVEPESEPEQ